MPLLPIRGLRYTKAAGDLADLVTEPYDKISPEMKVMYEARSPSNIVRLIRGDTAPGDDAWHGAAADRLQEMIAQGVLAHDEIPAYFIYRQRFTTPTGETHTRTAVVGGFDLSERNRVLHHERTHAGPRTDRRRLLDATGVHFGQIFVLRSEGPSIDRTLYDRAELIGEITDEHGTVHTFSALTDPEAVSAVRAAQSESSYVIADGHHRFTVACDHADDADRPGAGFCLLSAVDIDDPGLVVLPTHRAVSNLPKDRREALARTLKDLGATPHASSDARELLATMAANPGTLGVLTAEGAFTVNLGPTGETSDAEVLDTRRLEVKILTPLLEGLDVEDHLSYHRDPDAAARNVASGESDAVFYVAAIPAGTVADVSRAGGVMPQKSTDFFPKMLTGFVLYDTAVPPA